MALIGALLETTTAAVILESFVFLIIGLTWAVIAVTAATIVTRLSPAAIRGEAPGTYAAVAAGAGAFGSLLGGAVAEVSYLLAFVMAGGLVLLGAVLVYRLQGAVEEDDSAAGAADAMAPG